MTKTRLKVQGMHCTSCAMAIDMDLEDLPGVQEAKTNFARATTEVTFDPAQTSFDAIVAQIRETGYDAQPA